MASVDFIMTKQTQTTIYQNSDIRRNKKWEEGKEVDIFGFGKIISNIWDDTPVSKPNTKISKSNSDKKSAYVNTQDFVLIWLDGNIDQVSNSDSSNTKKQLQSIFARVHTFTENDACIGFLNDVKHENIFMIVSGSLGQNVVPLIHDMCHIHSIYVFCHNELKHRQWAQEWSKVRGVFTRILPLCEKLKNESEQCNQNAFTMSFVSSDDKLSERSLDHINPSFIYTQLLKEIFRTLPLSKKPAKDFIDYCRQRFSNDAIELENVNRFEREYSQHSPIWWYTYNCFLYSMLNQALRAMEFDIIIKMGFFIRDLLTHIETLHYEQFKDSRKSDTFTVYRGQGLTAAGFNSLKRMKGGLVSFNNFLSTSKVQSVSIDFARRSILNSDLTGVLFVITVDPSLSSTRFACIKKISCFRTEQEILFPMHSVFRVGHIKKIERDNDRLWQVELKLVSDQDLQDNTLLKRLRQETAGSTGWHRLGQFLIMIGQYNKAEELYTTLLENASAVSEQAYLNHHLGVVKDGQGDYEKAIYYYEKSLEVNREILSHDHRFLGSTYDGIGLVYTKMGNYPQALVFHQKALEIFQETLTKNDPHIGISNGNIGKVYFGMHEYASALSYYERALHIFQQAVPENHSHIAMSYSYIAKVHDQMGELSKALDAHKKALDIRKRILPPTHPLMAASYFNVGNIYLKTQNQHEGIRFIQQAIEVGKCSLPENHPDLQLYMQHLSLVDAQAS